MKRVRFLPAAAEDLTNIYFYVARQSGSKSVGRKLIAQLKARCREIAALPGTLGRARPELRADMRSLVIGNYVVFFRYTSDAFEVINIIEGHRDIDALFET